jgi:cell division protein FtsI (penicillin-binding protein 3)
MFALVAAIGMCFAAVVVRLVYVQAIASARYAGVGQSELLHQVVLPALRGSITDRQGDVLAMSVPQTTIVADPHQISDPRGYAARLAPILGVDQATLVHELTEDTHFVYLARQASDQVAAKVKALSLAGISYLSEPKRFRTDPQLALPVLGSVGIDGHGLSGLEYQYDKILSGQPGEVVLERDPQGNDIPGGVRSSRPAVSGSKLVLTLDSGIQYATEQALSSEIVKSKALDGTAVVMDSKTGAILAMANLVAGTNGGPPAPAPNNLAVTNVYEPGSVIKGVTFSGALEDHVTTPDQRYSVPGQISLYGSVFHDAEPHGTESLSTTDILAQSSNVGTIGIARDLGSQKLYQYLLDFGFGQPSGLGFPGESPGIMSNPRQWSGTAIASMAIGQDEAVTALQILDAYNAIANGGVWVTPRLISETVGANGVARAASTAPGRRVVSTTTARELTSMLEQVVQSPAGTGTAAAIPGYTVAGKTGTAQKPLPNGRGYQPGAYEASFVGFVPAEQPALTAVVVLDQPTPIFGGAVAAPVFAQIAQYGLRELDIPPAGPQSGPPSTSVPTVGGPAASPVRTTD